MPESKNSKGQEIYWQRCYMCGTLTHHLLAEAIKACSPGDVPPTAGMTYAHKCDSCRPKAQRRIERYERKEGPEK